MPKEKLTKKERKKETEKKEALKEKAKRNARELKEEMRKGVLTAITAAFGFIMALSWREVITDLITKLTAISPLSGKLMEAIIITIVCTIGIVILTKFSEKKD